MTRRSVCCLTLLLAALVSTSVSAQRITRRIFVAATAAGSPVLDLTAADFQIVENGTKREATRAALGKAPMRVVLLVDSSGAIPQMLNHFRAGLNAFFDALPPEHEVVFITTGGQTRIRVQPTTDRAALKTAAGRFAADGGANSFLDTLLESDKRFLRPVTQWPVFVILTTDNGDARVAPRITEYNQFLVSLPATWRQRARHRHQGQEQRADRRNRPEPDREHRRDPQRRESVDRRRGAAEGDRGTACVGPPEDGQRLRDRFPERRQDRAAGHRDHYRARQCHLAALPAPAALIAAPPAPGPRAPEQSH